MAWCSTRLRKLERFSLKRSQLMQLVMLDKQTSIWFSIESININALVELDLLPQG